MRIRTAFRALIGILLITVTAGCTSAGNGAAAPAASASGAGSDLPAGWRWESYGGVEVGVPGDWGWDNASQRLGQWCVGKVSSAAKPVVGRPGIATDVGCPGGGTALADTGTVVGFNRTEQADGVAHEGDRTTVRLDTVEVVVQAPAELRQRIVETIRHGRLDSNGCPSTQVISTKPQWRPGIAAKVESLRVPRTSPTATKSSSCGSGRPSNPPTW